jgi:hypothetical protein
MVTETRGAKVHLIASARLAVKVFCSGSEWLGAQVALESTVWITRNLMQCASGEES